MNIVGKNANYFPLNWITDIYPLDFKQSQFIYSISNLVSHHYSYAELFIRKQSNFYFFSAATMVASIKIHLCNTKTPPLSITIYRPHYRNNRAYNFISWILIMSGWASVKAPTEVEAVGNKEMIFTFFFRYASFECSCC